MTHVASDNFPPAPNSPVTIEAAVPSTLLTPPSSALIHASLFSDLIQLSKLRITLMVVITTWIGFALGRQGLGNNTPLLLYTLLGTALSCIGSSVLNQVWEKDTDALMHRTRHRPLPAARIQPRTALFYGLTTSLLGLLLLSFGANTLSAAVSAFTIISYVLLYTPLKRITSLATLVGAVPGALPPVIGYAAAANHLAPPAWALFAIMFLWQIPHFLAIAWLYRQDYALASFPMLPVIDPSGSSTFRQMLLGCALLLPTATLPYLMNISGSAYLSGTLLAGILFLLLAIRLIIRPSQTNARFLFFASLIYLPVVLCLMLIDRL